MAHSLGGVISLDYSLSHGKGISGLILIAPAISYEVTPFKKLLVTLLGKVKPNLTIEKSGDLYALTQDPEILFRLSSDILRHNTVTPGLGSGLMRTVPRVMNQAHLIQLPVLLLYGLNDDITPPEKLRHFFKSIGSHDKQMYEYVGMRHRPFDDLGREHFFADMLRWLERQTEAQ